MDIKKDIVLKHVLVNLRVSDNDQWSEQCEGEVFNGLKKGIKLGNRSNQQTASSRSINYTVQCNYQKTMANRIRLRLTAPSV